MVQLSGQLTAQRSARQLTLIARRMGTLQHKPRVRNEGMELTPHQFAMATMWRSALEWGGPVPSAIMTETVSSQSLSQDMTSVGAVPSPLLRVDCSVS